MMLLMVIVNSLRGAWDWIRDSVQAFALVIIERVAALGPVAHLLIIVGMTVVITRLVLCRTPRHQQ